MWGQSVELEHSQAAGSQAVLMLLGVCIAIILAAAVFALTIVHSTRRSEAIFAFASERALGPRVVAGKLPGPF